MVTAKVMSITAVSLQGIRFIRRIPCTSAVLIAIASTMMTRAATGISSSYSRARRINSSRLIPEESVERRVRPTFSAVISVFIGGCIGKVIEYVLS